MKSVAAKASGKPSLRKAWSQIEREDLVKRRVRKTLAVRERRRSVAGVEWDKICAAMGDQPRFRGEIPGRKTGVGI